MISAKLPREQVSDELIRVRTILLGKTHSSDKADVTGHKDIRSAEGASGNNTHMTISTVLTMTLCTPPPRIGSEITGSDSLTIIFARRSVTRSKCPF
jgi:hypothetical protein